MHILSLSPFNRTELMSQAVDAFLQITSFVRYLALPSWCFSSRFALNHNVKVDELMGDGRHIVFETEGVFANVVGREDVIPLVFPLPFKHDAAIRVRYTEINVEGSTRLDLSHKKASIESPAAGRNCLSPNGASRTAK